jgi:hypothetical protein
MPASVRPILAPRLPNACQTLAQLHNCLKSLVAPLPNDFSGHRARRAIHFSEKIHRLADLARRPNGADRREADLG